MLSNVVIIVSRTPRQQLACYMWPSQASEIFEHILQNPRDEIMPCVLKPGQKEPVVCQGYTVLASYVANEVFKTKDERIKHSVFLASIARLFNQIAY